MKIRRRRKIPSHEVEKFLKDGRPVYLCEKRHGQLIFWCPYCLTEHFHGAVNAAAFTPEWRSRHCTSEAGKRAHDPGYQIFYAD